MRSLIAVCAVTVLIMSPVAQADGVNPTGWRATTPYPFAGSDFDPAEWNGRVYVAGGWNGTTGVSEVYVAEITDTGSLGTWTATTSMPEADAGTGATAYNGWLYVSLKNGNIYRSQIASDGSLGVWLAESSAAPDHGGIRGTRAYGGHLYVFGGWDGTQMFDDVYLAPINDDGSLGGWSTTTAMPEPRQHASVHFHDGRVYIVGGITCNCCDACILDTAYSARVNSDGSLGVWRSEATLPHNLWVHNSILVGGQLFIFGGRTGYSSSPVANIYRGTIMPSNGSIVEWELIGVLPTPYTSIAGVVHADALGGVTYYIGGHDTITPALSAGVYFSGSVCPSDIQPDGSINVTDLLELLAAWGTCP